MLKSFEWMIALRYLRAKRKERFVSVIAAFSFLGIALGVGTLIVVMAVMNGFHTELLNRILGINSHLSIFADARGIDDYDDVVKDIKTLPHVIKAHPVIEGQVMATGGPTAMGGSNNGAIVRGVRAGDLGDIPLVADSLIGAKPEDLAGTDVVFIGEILARNLGVTVGDTVTLISPQMTQTVMGAIPRLKEYRVAGLFNVGMFEYDSTTIFMPLEAAQLYFKYPGAVSRIDVMLDNAHSTTAVIPDIMRMTGERFLLRDWKAANSSYFGAIQVERNVMFLILTLIIIVAAFNIITSLIMLVKDKGRDIAILRTMGVSKGSIMRIFIVCGAAIGVIGTFLGLVLGVLFALNIESIRRWLESMTGTELFAAEIYFLSKLPAEVQGDDVVLVVSMSLVLSLLATIFPAWKASRQNPVEGIRYE